MPICDYADELTYDGTNKTSRQSIVGVAGAAIIGGRVKDGVAAKDWGAGEDRRAYLRCVDALVGASGGLQVDIVAADDGALVTNPTVLATKTIPAAQLTANSLHQLPRLAAGARKRRLGVKLTPLTTNSTAGSVVVGFLDKDGAPQDGVNWL